MLNYLVPSLNYVGNRKRKLSEQAGESFKRREARAGAQGWRESGSGEDGGGRMNRLRELGGGWLRWRGWRVVTRPGQQPFQDPEKIPTRKNTYIVYKAESECHRCPDSMTYIVIRQNQSVTDVLRACPQGYTWCYSLRPCYPELVIS